MTPSYAERARTLVRGRLPGALRVGNEPEPRPVRHASDAGGRPLLLIRDGDPVAAAGVPGGGDRVELWVDDVPPVPAAPSLGRLRVGGRMRRLAPLEQTVAADEFATANPLADLLDLGRGLALYAIDADRVLLDDQEVPLPAYTTAEPDPLHELEPELLRDLADHHGPQVESYFRFLLAISGVPCCARPRPVRLDRYGFVVDIGSEAGGEQRWVRLGFHRPVHCRHELAHLLRPVLFGSR